MTDLERFNALTQDERDTVLENNRQINVDWDYEWYDSVYEFFVQDMKEVGVYVERIYFSGFWSQGDGACCEGQVEDWREVLKAVCKPEDLQRALECHERAEEFSLSWKQRGHYYHENSMDFNETVLILNTWEDEGGIRAAAGEVIATDDNTLADTLMGLVTEFIKNSCRELYHDLEEEYEYLTSDEAVLESLIANERLGEEIDEACGTEKEDEESSDESELGCLCGAGIPVGKGNYEGTSQSIAYAA